MDIKVTEEHIRRAASISHPLQSESISTSCPIAQALKDRFPHSSVSVGNNTCTIDDHVYDMLPKDEVEKVTREYPWLWGEIKPFDLTIDILDSVIKFT